MIEEAEKLEEAKKLITRILRLSLFRKKKFPAGIVITFSYIACEQTLGLDRARKVGRFFDAATHNLIYNKCRTDAFFPAAFL